MKHYSIFLCFLILGGCKDPGPGIFLNSDSSNKYPTKLNNTWEYSTQRTTEYYDSQGSIYKQDKIDAGNTHLWITKTNDTLPGYSSLILFEINNNNSPQYIGKFWYQNSDQGLFSIAASVTATDPFVQPKISVSKKHFTLKEFKEFTGMFLPAAYNPAVYDSIQYQIPPRQVLSYPLHEGDSWIELNNFIYRQRTVAGIELININSISYKCYKIVAEGSGILINDYISLETGLVKRIITADSLEISTLESPEGINKFVKFTEESVLVSKNF